MANILVAYFSFSGKTREVAEKIASKTGADVYEIKTVKQYPAEQGAVIEASKLELSNGERPELAAPLPDVSGYDTIILGFPNWISTCPMAVLTFCEGLDLSGKKIMPFITHGGGGKGRTDGYLEKACPNSNVIACADGNDFSDEAELDEWLKDNGI